MALAPQTRGQTSTATGIRTRVSAMRGRRPSPLDDSGAQWLESRLAKRSRAGLRRYVALDEREREAARTLQACRAGGALSSLACRHADVAELVDAHGSGPCLGNQVEVRVLSSASPEAHASGGVLRSIACSVRLASEDAARALDEALRHTSPRERASKTAYGSKGRRLLL